MPTPPVRVIVSALSLNADTVFETPGVSIPPRSGSPTVAVIEDMASDKPVPVVVYDVTCRTYSSSVVTSAPSREPRFPADTLMTGCSRLWIAVLLQNQGGRKMCNAAIKNFHPRLFCPPPGATISCLSCLLCPRDFLTERLTLIAAEIRAYVKECHAAAFTAARGSQSCPAVTCRTS
jgi:hypothetical protein